MIQFNYLRDAVHANGTRISASTSGAGKCHLTPPYQSELIGQCLHHTISLMYVGARHLEFGITYHIVT